MSVWTTVPRRTPFKGAPAHTSEGTRLANILYKTSPVQMLPDTFVGFRIPEGHAVSEKSCAGVSCLGLPDRDVSG